MNMPMQWRKNPRPVVAVAELADTLQEAAHKGQVRAIAVVTINPMLEIEFDCAGDLDDVRKTLLIGGLTRLIKKISE
jgi:hypothetical protein